MDIPLTALTISSALELISAGDITQADLVSACRKRIEEVDPDINAIIQQIEDPPTDPPPQSLLRSIPIAIKDMIDVSGCRTMCGSPFFFGSKNSEKDAQCVKKLRNAGAVIIGRCNMHEIALGVTGVNPHFGAVHNPHDLGRIAGGSSSGSAAAVASGMVLAAIGTDTGGSIRIPAALCGVVGYKPTRGLVSMRGVAPLSWSLDHVGPITKNVRDSALLLQVLAGYDPFDVVSVDREIYDYLEHINDGILDLRIAFPTVENIKEADDQVVNAFQESVLIFRELGSFLNEVDLSWMMDLALYNSLITQKEAAVFHQERLALHPDWFGEDVQQRLSRGESYQTYEYINAKRMQMDAIRRFDELFEEFDLILTPTTPVPALMFNEITAVTAAKQLTMFTSPFNLTGLPAISLPCGYAKSGLPIGLQIAGKPWADALVLRAGAAFELAAGVHCLHDL